MSRLSPTQQTRCEALRKKGKLHKEIAKELKVSESKVRRHLQSVGMGGDVPSSRIQRHRIGGSPEFKEIVRLRDEVARLTTEIQSHHRDALVEDEIRKILGVLGDSDASPPSWLVRAKETSNAPEVPVAMWADWHGGEVVSSAETNGVNEFNIKILKERVRKLVERTLRLTDKHAGVYPGIVLNLVGDFVSGGLHPELQKTDEVETISSVLVVRDLMIWGITAFAERFGKVYVPCACGNHGRSTHKPEFKRYVYKNFDWLIYKLLEKHFENDPRVQFDIRPANEVFYRVWNKRFLLTHGDMLGVRGGDGIIGAIGPIARGEVKVRGAAASSVSDYDCLLIGHWHQALWLPRVVVSNTLKGYDEYARLALRAPVTLPSQSLFFVHPRYGITSRWEIYLEGKDTSKVVEWVSVFDQAKAA